MIALRREARDTVHVRICLVLIILAGCDLRPKPKSEPPPAPPPTAPAVVADAGVADDAPVATDGGISEACLALGDHIASVWIDSAKDVAERAALAQDRPKLAQKSAEACAQLGWNEAMRNCYMNAKTVEQLGPCAGEK